jgi:hypothetical protein
LKESAIFLIFLNVGFQGCNSSGLLQNFTVELLKMYIQVTNCVGELINDINDGIFLPNLINKNKLEGAGGVLEKKTGRLLP